VAATIAPDTFNAVAKAAVPAYAALSGQPVPSSAEVDEATAKTPPTEDLANALQQRNADYQAQYGNDPNQAGNRLVGQVLGSTPVMSAAGKAFGGIVNMATKESPAFAQWVAQSPTAAFLAGKVASNAVVDSSGAVTQGATIGNKLAQYGASGLHAAATGAPAITALTNAGSDEPVGRQLAQNAAVAGTLGVALPAAFDTGAAVINKGKQLLGGPDAAATQRAQNVLQQLAGGMPTKSDTTEYIPGSTPSAAKAAAYAGDPNAGNVAALEKTLSESKVGSEQLYTPAFREQEVKNDLARRDFTLQLTQTPEDVTQLQKARSDAAGEMMGNEAQRLTNPELPKGTVWQNNGESDVSKALQFIDAAKEGPAAGNAGLRARLDTIRKLLTSPQAKDPQYIYESVIKPQITDVLDNTNPFAVDNATKSQLPYMKQLKGLLDESVSSAAPEYRGYLQDYASRSRGIERLQGLQSLNLVNPEAETSVPTLNKVNNALKKVQEGRSNYDPTDPFKSLTNDYGCRISTVRHVHGSGPPAKIYQGGNKIQRMVRRGPWVAASAGASAVGTRRAHIICGAC